MEKKILPLGLDIDTKRHMAHPQRAYERIDIELPCRLFIPMGGKREELKFEAFAKSQNLGMGGVFVKCTFLMRTGVHLWIELGLPDEALAVRGQVAHVIPLDNPDYPSGMGIQFLDVDSKGRETLLRFFAPERYVTFYQSMTSEFSHMRKQYDIRDVAFVLNLWEEWKIQQEGGPAATESGVPEPTPKRSSRRR